MTIVRLRPSLTGGRGKRVPRAPGTRPARAVSGARRARCGARLLALLLLAPGLAAAGEPSAAPATSGSTVVIQSDGQRKVIHVPPGSSPAAARGDSPRPQEMKKPGEKPAEKPGPRDGKPGPGDKDDRKQDAKEKTEPPAVVQRGDEPPEPPDLAELETRPDPQGQVRVRFRGQSWPDVLEWLGTISGMSVDWQQLPGDYVNLATQREYTVPEIRNLLNRMLLARGFTMLQRDDVLTVHKCDQLNAALVPSVAADELATLQPYDFVRVLFDLDWLVATQAAEELKPLISSNGKLLPLSATNRIEAMDAAVNLRGIHQLLQQEQSRPGDTSRLVREFVLRYARAEEVREDLTEFMGLQSDNAMPALSRMSSRERARYQAMMQAQMQAMQRAQQRSSSSSRATRTPTPPRPKEEPVRLMVNRRRNSILAQAPPNKMAVIADAIQLLDVPPDRTQSLQGFLGRMQVYRLCQLDPEKLVASLTEFGNLDPSTRLEADSTNRAIIAYATPADHFTIQSTIEKLDSSARSVEVITLRRLRADEVAGTIQFLMVGERDEPQSRRSSYYGYSPFGYSRRSSDESREDEFRVDADVANNRLLVRANDAELEEVVSILVKLGEIPPEEQLAGTTRVLDIVPGADTKAFFQQLEQQWKALAPNPLVFPERPAADGSSTPSQPPPAGGDGDSESAGAPEQAKPAAEKSKTTPAAADPSPAPRPAANRITAAVMTRAVVPCATPASEPEEASPIAVSVGPDGRLIVTSQDARALARFEELAARLAPPRKDYKVFKLEYASATWVSLNLEDFFAEDEEEDGRDRFLSWMYGRPSEPSSRSGPRLSSRKPPKFISDIDTNSILVRGADPEQLKTIAELIELYDIPEPLSSQNVRVTRLFSIRYSKASIVAETIKDAFRDLLSSNDKAFRQQGKQQQQPQRYASGIAYVGPFGTTSDSGQPARTQARFKGKLSIGVDDVSNTLLVSTEGENLMELIAGMIELLDQAAQPASELSVVAIGSRGSEGSRLQQALQKVLNGQRNGGPPAQPQQRRPQRPTPGMPNNTKAVVVPRS